MICGSIGEGRHGDRWLWLQAQREAIRWQKVRGLVLSSFGKEPRSQDRTAAQRFADSPRQPITAIIDARNDTPQELSENLDRAGFLAVEGAKNELQ